MYLKTQFGLCFCRTLQTKTVVGSRAVLYSLAVVRYLIHSIISTITNDFITQTDQIISPVHDFDFPAMIN